LKTLRKPAEWVKRIIGMSQVKKIARLFILLFFTSCRLFRSSEQNAINDINKYHKKLNTIYAQYPQFKRDTIKGVVEVPVPIKEIDTVVLYKDSVVTNTIYKEIVERVRDTVFAKKIVKKMGNYRCIKDSIVVQDTLFKAVVRQDSLGIHVNIYPKDTVLKAKYAVVCPPVICKEDKFWEHQEFWFVSALLFLTIVGILIHLRLQR
jgi:hypothetical protein